MKQRNNLDELFKDSLEHYKARPDDDVWHKIEASLNQKKKKRILPIWWQLGGIAALLLIALLVYNPFRSSELLESESNIEVSNTKSSDAVKSIEESELDNTDDIPEIDYNNVVTDQKTTKDYETLKHTEKQENNAKPNGIFKESTTGFASNTSGKTSQERSQKTKAFHTSAKGSSKSNAIVANPNRNIASTATNKNNQKGLPASTGSDKTAQLTPSKNNLDANSENAIVLNTKQETEKTEDAHEIEKQSIYDAIKEGEETTLAKTTTNRKWSVGPTVAPVYYNSLGEGSPIHSAFASNAKSGNLNLSYGLTVSYSISEKLQLRSGIHKVDYGYNTDEVSFSPNAQAFAVGQIANIDYENTARSIVVTSRKSNVTAVKDNPEIASNEVAPLQGSMVQQMNYLEIPMELNYVLLDKKVGVNLIGGFSSLFLLDNAVSLESDNLVTEVGEANNVNTLNFSTNIGIGLDYKISPVLKFNLEPMFKYQLNTFENTAGNFKPYAVGVYSGLQFKF